MVWLVALCLALRLGAAAGCSGTYDGATHLAFPICHASTAADDIHAAHHHDPAAPSDDHCPCCALHACADLATLASAPGQLAIQTTIVGLPAPTRHLARAVGIGIPRPIARGPPSLV